METIILTVVSLDRRTNAKPVDSENLPCQFGVVADSDRRFFCSHVRISTLVAFFLAPETSVEDGETIFPGSSDNFTYAIFFSSRFPMVSIFSASR